MNQDAPQGTPATVNPALLNEMSRSYLRTAVLRSAVELKIFDALADGPQPAPAVATALDADPRGVRILLSALAAFGLLQRGPAGFALAPGAAPLLVSSSPSYQGGNLRVAASDWEWEALGRLSEAVRAGGSVLAANADTPNFAFWEDFAQYATPFTARGAQLVATALDGWGTGRSQLRVLDAACGHGQYGFGLATARPEVHLTCLDWPNVLDVTAQRAQQAGLSGRVDFRPGDMFTADPGGPYDALIIANVLHHFAEDRATALLTRLAKSLRPDGRLVIVGFTVDDSVAPEVDPRPHLFSLHMLTLTRDGETHSVPTYHRMLSAAGFGDVQVHTEPGNPLTILVGATGSSDAQATLEFQGESSGLRPR